MACCSRHWSYLGDISTPCRNDQVNILILTLIIYVFINIRLILMTSQIRRFLLWLKILLPNHVHCSKWTSASKEWGWGRMGYFLEKFSWNFPPCSRQLSRALGILTKLTISLSVSNQRREHGSGISEIRGEESGPECQEVKVQQSSVSICAKLRGQNLAVLLM